MPLTETGRAILLSVVRQPPGPAYITLHEWDADWNAYKDREDGIFGRQASNRAPFVGHAARVENPLPGWTELHVVVWSGDGRPWFWTLPNLLHEGDEMVIDLRRDVRLG